MSQPNIVFVLTDDQGYGDLSCLGNPVLRTPCIDRLHDESVRFTDFHVAPMCTPTRGELLTGRDALYNGATFVCLGRTLLRSELPTMANIFAANGYHTGHFGKWHLGDNYPYRPQDRGFYETVYHPAWGITSPPDYFGNDYFDDHYRHQDEIKQYRGYCTDVWFEQAIAWMRRCHQQGDSFFTYIATNAPHGPLWVPNQYRQPYLGEVTRNEASFFGMIASIDENMERLELFLKETGLSDNTILIFMTDNGTATGENVFNAGIRGRKTSLYDGGHTEKNGAAVLWNTWRLVHGTELYDISTDMGQNRDVAASNSDVVGRMQDYYEQWWASVGSNLDLYQPITIGSNHENPVRLCSCDWAWTYADNQENIRGCVMDSGTWHVDVARDGVYSLTLRRWPEESGLGIAAAAPVMQGFDATLPEGVALPVASAWLRAGDEEQTQRVPEGTTHVTFRLALSRCAAQVQSWWYDEEGNRLAGAYYLTAEHISD